MAAGRQLNETTKDWLERLISIGASDAQINGVTAILQQESKGIFPKVNSKFFDNHYFYFLAPVPVGKYLAWNSCMP
jgi:hypothetical protein